MGIDDAFAYDSSSSHDDYDKKKKDGALSPGSSNTAGTGPLRLGRRCRRDRALANEGQEKMASTVAADTSGQGKFKTTSTATGRNSRKRSSTNKTSVRKKKGRTIPCSQEGTCSDTDPFAFDEDSTNSEDHENFEYNRNMHGTELTSISTGSVSGSDNSPKVRGIKRSGDTEASSCETTPTRKNMRGTRIIAIRKARTTISPKKNARRASEEFIPSWALRAEELDENNAKNDKEDKKSEIICENGKHVGNRDMNKTENEQEVDEDTRCQRNQSSPRSLSSGITSASGSIASREADSADHESTSHIDSVNEASSSESRTTASTIDSSCKGSTKADDLSSSFTATETNSCPSPFLFDEGSSSSNGGGGVGERSGEPTVGDDVPASAGDSNTSESKTSTCKTTELCSGGQLPSSAESGKAGYVNVSLSQGSVSSCSTSSTTKHSNKSPVHKSLSKSVDNRDFKDTGNKPVVASIDSMNSDTASSTGLQGTVESEPTSDKSLAASMSPTTNIRRANKTSPLKSPLGRTKAQRMRARNQLKRENPQSFSQDTSGTGSSSLTSSGAASKSTTSALKSEGSNPKSGYRRVRFSFLGNETLPNSLKPSASNKQEKVTPVASSASCSGKGRRRKRPQLWLQDKDENESGYESPSDAPDNGKSSQFTTSPCYESSPETVRQVIIRGAKQDAEQVLISGSWEVLIDQASYLANSILKDTDAVSAHQQVENMVELALLLSEKKNRLGIFRNDPSLLQSILKIIGLAPKLCREQQTILLMTPSSVGTSLQTDRIGQRLHPDPKSACERSLAALVHFLSLDSVIDPLVVARLGTNLSNAKALRRKILTDSLVLKGILLLVLHDPVSISYAPGKRQASNATQTKVNSLKPCQMAFGPMCAEECCISTASPSSAYRGALPLNGITDSKGSPASTCSSATSCFDPTKAGRRRRRNKKAPSEIEKSAKLEAVPEQEQASNAEDTFLVDAEAHEVKSSSKNVEDQLELLGKRVQQSTVLLLRSSRGTSPNSPLKETHEAGLPHTCSDVENCNFLLTNIPLLALSRIINGKLEGINNSSCANGNGDHSTCLGTTTEDEDNEKDDVAAFLETNTLLGNSDILPLLSQALAETAEAFVYSQVDGVVACEACLAHLLERLKILVSIVDGAVLFHESNRLSFCQSFGSRDQIVSADSPVLVAKLISVLRRLLKTVDGQVQKGRSMWDGFVGEAVLESLRTLTSLSHENWLAAQQLTTLCDGLPVLGCVLQNAVRNSPDCIQEESKGTGTSHVDTEDDRRKLIYDATVFCLNILINVVESGPCPQQVATVKIGGKDDTLFLAWLVDWVVGQTQSFREALFEGSFGSSNGSLDKDNGRALEKQEDEKLVLAGNGCILISWLLIKGKTEATREEALGNILQEVSAVQNERKEAPCSISREGSAEKIEQDKDDNAGRIHDTDKDDNTGSIHDIILTGLPGNNAASKVSFVMNTLKAFCNFHHMTMGDLSVAVVTPVKNLMLQLENSMKQSTMMSQPDETQQEIRN